MKFIITGDNGFVGTATKQFLANNSSISVTGYDLMRGQDIRNGQQLDTFLAENAEAGDIILHLAAVARFAEADKEPLRAIETNVLGTRNIASLADKYHLLVVYASTGSVYMPIEQPPPITEEFRACGNSVYGVTKYGGEEYIRRMAMPWIILRYAHLYGKEKRHHGLIGGFLDRINRGLAPTLYGGKQGNDFCYIKDVARANYLAMTAPWDKWNQVYNIGTGEELTAEQAGKMVCEIAGYTGEITKEEGRTVDPEHFVYDITKAERMLNFRAKFSFKDGLADMYTANK